MRRRKLLISIGALGAGGTAAFGTEAFTSVEAERSVDVEIAGDSSAFLTIEPLSGKNANQYVSTDDGTVALDFDGDAGTDGSGVNQDAVTQVEDLFKIINQGTQEVSVFFQDKSTEDAVTFRVTRSTDTSTKGPSGESLEGADNSVELETGEQVAVGITVDTLNNDVSGSLVDDVTIRAEAGASAPGQNIPEPQFVVSNSPDGSPNQFGDVQSAINQLNSDNGDQSGAVIGIEGGFNKTNTDNQPDINVPGVTLTGFNGSTPQIGTLEITAGDVTVKNVDVDGGVSVASNTSDVTIDGVTFDGNGNSIGTGIDNLTITNSIIQGGGVEFGLSSSASAEISNNSIDAGSGIGISVTSANNANLTIENNEVTNVDPGEVGIKVDGSNVNINRETGKIDAIESLLAENGINTATVNGTTRQRKRIVVETVDDLNDRAGFTSIQDAIDGNGPQNGAASEKINAGGTILVENGTFDESVTIDVESLTLEGPNAGIAGNSSERGAEANINGLVAVDAEQVTIDGFAIEREAGGSLSAKGVIQMGAVGDSASGSTIANNVITPDDTNGGNASLGGVAIESADNVTISDNVIDPATGSADTIGITRYVSNIENLTVSDNVIETTLGMTFGGTDANDKRLTYSASITGNQFDTTGDKTDEYSLAVYESENLDVTVTGNEFSAAGGTFVTSVAREDAPFEAPDDDGEKLAVNQVVDDNSFNTTDEVTTTPIGADSTYIVDDAILD